VWLKSLLHVSWLALTLAILIEVIAFAVDAALGQAEGLTEFALGLIQKIAWSLPLCAALALITQRSFMMGIAGLLTAPLAVLLSGILENQFRELFMSIVSEPFHLENLGMAVFRGLEYGLLGTFVGYLVQKERNSFFNHSLVGIVIGAVFGGILVSVQLHVPYTYFRETLLHNSSEFIFPLGCSVILKMTNDSST
jgi:hypothetical protein